MNVTTRGPAGRPALPRSALRRAVGRAGAASTTWGSTAGLRRAVVRASDASVSWGSTASERAAPLACDRHLPGALGLLHRAIDIDAPPAVVFRWLCQLRVAPYSYDLIDNFGRRSPQHLIPGLDELAVGQRFMTIFDLAEFEPDRQITLAVRDRARWAFGSAAVTYLVGPRGAAHPRAAGGAARTDETAGATHCGAAGASAGRAAGAGAGAAGSRLLVRIASRHESRVLPWLDLLMMRRQLLNLKRLAEGRVVGGRSANSRRGPLGN